MEQRSAEWHAWRLDGIGSSEASILMGHNPYKSVERLWLEKTRQVDCEFYTNADMQRGIDFEDVAREKYEQQVGYGFEEGDELQERIAREKYEVQVGIGFEPCTRSNPEFPFIRGSFDGVNWLLRRFVEIKCPREWGHLKTVQENYVKPEYYAQMQHFYLVSPDLEACDYISFFEGKIHVIPVPKDIPYGEELKKRGIIFWDHVVRRVKPSLSLFPRYSNVAEAPTSYTEF